MQEAVGQLIDAAMDGELDTLTQLLQTGVSVNAKDSSGDTALLGACYNGSELAVIQLLLRAEADPNHQNNFGDSVIQAAGEDADPEVCNLHLV